MEKKNLFWVLGLLVFAALSFTACSEEEDEKGGATTTTGEISAANLVGLWESEYDGAKYAINGKLDDEWKESYGGLRLLFNADGTFSYFGRSIDNKWDEIHAGKWSLQGNEIHFTLDEGEQMVTIKKLTSTQSILEEYSLEILENGDKEEVWRTVEFKKVY